MENLIWTNLNWTNTSWENLIWDNTGGGTIIPPFPEVAVPNLLWKLADEPVVFTGLSSVPTAYATSQAIPFKDVFNKHLELSLVFGRPGVTLTGNTASTFAYVSIHSSAYGTPQPAFANTHLPRTVVGNQFVTWSRLIANDTLYVNHGDRYALESSFFRQTAIANFTYTLPPTMFATGNEYVYFDLIIADDRPTSYAGSVTITSLEVRAYDIG